MKTNAVIRIILWGIIALLLSGILVAVMKDNGDLTGFVVFSDAWGDDSRYTVGAASVPVQEIRNIQVHWTSGRVEICPTQEREIRFEEGNITDPAKQLRYRIQGDTLIIHYGKRQWFSFFASTPDKTLKLYVPVQMFETLQDVHIESASATVEIADIVMTQSLHIESASGNVQLTGVQAKNIDVENVSGEIGLEQSAAKQCNLEAVSGTIHLQGEYEKVGMQSVSGNITLETDSAPGEIEAESVSGSITLRLPTVTGFRVELETVSGGFQSEYPLTSQGDTYIYGDADAAYDIETVSGNVQIQK